jgi:tetratricopeptide (TPR) repeat protein
VERALDQRWRSRAPARRTLRSLHWLIAAAIGILCGSAFAWGGLWLGARRASQQARAPQVAAAAPAAQRAAAPRPIAATAAAAPVVALTGPSATAARAPVARTTAASAAVEATQAAPDVAPDAAPAISSFPDPPGTLTAQELLKRANAARSRGELTRAAALLGELQTRFPASGEAQVSRVALGKIESALGAHERALQQFSSYLATGGSLDEEALAGRGEALCALGRKPEELSAWQTLLTRFPASVYARRARERFEVLTSSASP